MIREPLLHALEAYAERWAHPALARVVAPFQASSEQEMVARFERFVRGSAECFERTHPPGHLTGAALVVSADLQRVLLTHHRKLDMWLQLGGHADGHPLLHEVSRREAEEESGLSGLSFLECGELLRFAIGERALPLPFDLDVHEIPARRSEPAHLHYDVRYVLRAGGDEGFVVSEESHELRWLALDEARMLTAEPSMHRMFDKLELIRRLQEG